MKSWRTPDRPTFKRLMLVTLTSLGLTLTTELTTRLTNDVRAQSSGAPSLRDTLTRRTSTAATGAGVADAEVGSISGGERFIRKRRRRTAFVGRDSNEMSSFVGEIQGSTDGNVRSAVSSLRVPLQRNANLSIQRTNQAPRGIYEPPVSIGFNVEAVAPAAQAASLEKLLNDSVRIRRVSLLSVEVDARTATLVGVVASAEDRQLAEAYLLFEPGLSKVVNQLTIQTPAEQLPHPRHRSFQKNR